ncbi:hypothetical protein [Streptomyces pimonensis]|uniref:hypothetical protein n=1 Tax=Streptomyces pimonensis TaxID=2860288 RepID=UPI003526D552
MPTGSLARALLGSGRPADLCELRTSSPYGGLPEGCPWRPLSDRKTDRLLRPAERAFPGAPAHLVPPSREHPDQYAGASVPWRRCPP